MESGKAYINMIILFFVILIGGAAVVAIGSMRGLKAGKAQAPEVMAQEGHIKDAGYYAVIGYSQKDEEYARTVKRICDSFYPSLLNDFDMDKEEKIAINIYSSPSELSMAVGVDYMEKPPMGVYYKGVINILSPDNWNLNAKEHIITDRLISDGPVIHEMAHLLLDEKTGGNYDIWFSEGVALYYENKYSGFEWRKDIKSSGVISLGEIRDMFLHGGDDLAYRRAFEIVKAIGDNGEAELLEIYEKLGAGEDFEAVISEYWP